MPSEQKLKEMRNRLSKLFLQISINHNDVASKEVIDLFARLDKEEKLQLVNAKDEYGNTLLHNTLPNISSDAENTLLFPLLKLFIENSADVNAKNNDGKTPLHRAVSNSDANFRAQATQLLLENGANIHDIDYNGRTPLHYSVYYASIFKETEGTDLSTAKLLLENGADVNARDNKGKTPLHVAVAHPSKKISEFLLKYGADINIKDNDGNTPLQNAFVKLTAPWELQKILEMLLDQGAEVPNDLVEKIKEILPYVKIIKHPEKEDVFYKAKKAFKREKMAQAAKMAVQGDLDKLLRNRREVIIDDDQNKIFQKVFEYLAATGNPLMFSALRHASKTFYSISQNVLEASQPNFKSIFVGTYSKHFNLPYKKSEREMKLFFLLFLNNKDDDNNLSKLQKFFAELTDTQKKEVLNKKDICGSISLHGAITKNSSSPIEILKLLIENGSDVNAQNNDGNTPLHCAARKGELDIVKLLIANGADVNAQNKKNITPLGYAYSNGHTEIINTLLSVKAEKPIHDSKLKIKESKLRTLKLIEANKEEKAHSHRPRQRKKLEEPSSHVAMVEKQRKLEAKAQENQEFDSEKPPERLRKRDTLRKKISDMTHRHKDDESKDDDQPEQPRRDGRRRK